MERMYTALTRLATAALVCGLIVVTTLTLNSGQYYPSNSGGDFAPSYVDTLWIVLPALFLAFVYYLTRGIALLGIAVAWAERRRSWAIALVAAAAVGVVFPFTLPLGSNFFAIHPRIGQLIGQNVALLSNLLSLAPSALVLVMARQSSGRVTERTRADATLEITRSRL